MAITKAGITRRELAALVGAAAVAGSVASAQETAPPILDLADWSYSFVGVEHAVLARGTICNGMQMFVERFIPVAVRHPYAIVLIHGGWGQGSDWFSAPDAQQKATARRGWAQLLLEQGYKVYVVDRPGQGRNPYFPWTHGYFDEQAPTLEATERSVKNAANTQWPGDGDANDYAVLQATAAMGQPMANNALTQNVWRTRGAMLLDEIGPAILLTHGDGAVFAWVAAQERPQLVKAIVVVEQPAASINGQTVSKLTQIPLAIVSAEASSSVTSDPAIADALRKAGCSVDHIVLAQHNIRGNGPMVMWEKNNREALVPVLAWMNDRVEMSRVPARTNDAHPNRESTALRLADQGCFWIGGQRKQTAYGTVVMGQQYVQYMIPAERRSPYPVVMIHGGGGQGTHMMGIGGRPGWVHYFVQAGYAVYWLDRPGFGRSPYHPDTLGPSHLRNVPANEGLVQSTAVFNTAQWPGVGGMSDPLVDQFMACEVGNVSDEKFHSELAWPGGAELLDRIGPSILLTHAFGGFWGWGVADRRPKLVKAIVAMEINSNPFVGQFRWGLTAAPMTFDPPVTDPAQFVLVDKTAPADSPRPVVSPYKLQAEAARKWKNLQGLPVAWLTSEFGGGGSPVAQVDFLNQVGCNAEILRLRDYGIHGNGNLMLLEKNNHEVFAVIRDWLAAKVPRA